MADKNKPGKRPPASRTRRGLKLGAMSASLAGRYAAGKIRDLVSGEDEARRNQDHAEMGKRIADTLGELKGAVMKVGQIASQVSDLLPAEVSEQLRILQKQAPPMPYSVIHEQITSSLGSPPEELYASIDESPCAAASIGQVHAATLKDGREVIVKVQYPGVRDSCDADLAQLKTAMQLGRLMKVSGKALNKIFEEIRERIHEELEYETEASNLIEFARLHADTPWLHIPEPIESLCSNEVLTMTKLSGDPLSDLRELNYPQDSINLVSQRIVEMMSKQLFDFHAIHADPHPGNFAADREGNLIVYDFGCIKRLSNTAVTAYLETINAGLAGDVKAIDAGLIKLGARLRNREPLPDHLYMEWREILMRPFLEEPPYNFATSRQHKDAMRLVPEVMRYMDRLQPPADTMYVDRLITGHYWNLVHLGAEVDVQACLKNYLTLPNL